MQQMTHLLAMTSTPDIQDMTEDRLNTSLSDVIFWAPNQRRATADVTTRASNQQAATYDVISWWSNQGGDFDGDLDSVFDPYQSNESSTSFYPNTRSNATNYTTPWNFSSNDVITNDNVMMEPNYWTLVLLAFPALTIFGNVLVCLSVYRERALRTATNYFVVSLAVADILVSILVMPLAVYVELNHAVWELGNTLCDAWVAADVMCCTASILNLTAISVDRCIAVTRPIQYAKFPSSRRILATLVLTWVVSIAVSSPIVLGINYTDRRTETPLLCAFYNSDFIIYSSMTSFYVPCVVMMVLYAKIFREIRSREKNSAGGFEKRRKKSLSAMGVVCHGGRGKIPGGSHESPAKEKFGIIDDLTPGNKRENFNVKHSDQKLALRCDTDGRNSLKPRLSSLLEADLDSPLFARRSDIGLICNRHSLVPRCASGDSSQDSSVSKRLSLAGMVYANSITPRRDFIAESFQANLESVRISKKKVVQSNFTSAQKCNISANSHVSTMWQCDVSVIEHSPHRSGSLFHNPQTLVGLRDEKVNKKPLQCQPDFVESRIEKLPINLLSGCAAEFETPRPSFKYSKDSKTTLLDSGDSGQFQKDSLSRNTATIKPPRNYSSGIQGISYPHRSVPVTIPEVSSETSVDIDEVSHTKATFKRVAPALRAFAAESHNILKFENSLARAHPTSHDEISVTVSTSDDAQLVAPASECVKTKNTLAERRKTLISARSKTRAAKRERKVTKTLAAVLGGFLICWVPFFSINIINAICIRYSLYEHALCNIDPSTFSLFVWLGYINSFLNPIIYTVFNSDFRRAFRKLLCRPCK